MAIEKVAVIGAGVMGAGIAAHMANAGLAVELLDIVPKTGDDRDAIAKGAIEKMLKTSPAPLMHKRNAKKIRPGNIEDHLERLKECDLIVEAVLENIDIKSGLYRKIAPHRKTSAVIASNTSTIPLEDLVEGQESDFKKHFMITHFFNPPRYMPLLELVTSEHNDPAKVAEVTRFMDEKLGKGVVNCNDTPGFIANRIGTFWLQCAISEAVHRKLTVEEADAVCGRPMGIPKTGVFGLVDLVGLDLMPHISKSLLSKLPQDDGYAKIHENFPVIDKMIEDGYTGRKGKGGFYRLNEKREKLAIDLETGTVRPAAKPKLDAVQNAKKGGLKALVQTDDRIGQYAWAVLKQVLCYAAEHAHDIATDIVAVDAAMKLGYNWKYGPFELLDKLGVEYFTDRIREDGLPVPHILEQAEGRSFYRTHNGVLQFLNRSGAYEDVKRAEGVLLLSDIKRRSKPVAKNMSASLWDIGDGVLCLEFHSKMNALDFMTMRMMNKACDIVESGAYKALVIHNEGDDFSVGANIGLALYAAKIKLFPFIGWLVQSGQKAYKRLKYAKFPVVGAPAGKALGGGCEVLLHCHHVQAHAETYPGLVEVGVGLLPAWGGCAELLTRAFKSKKMPGGPMPKVAAVFETVSTAKVGFSAFEAKDLLYFRETDGVTMNRQRLLADAKAKALDMLKDFKPEEPFDMELPGLSGKAALSLAVDGFYLKGLATPYDVVVSDRVAAVLTGGDKAGPGITITQDYLRMLERKHFMALVRDPRTVARIAAILKTGKPLREPATPGVSAAELRDSGKDCACPITKSVCGIGNDNTPAPTGKAKVNWPG
ncbi:MAG: 3-hydroxyacyl-CoA dehydrogenase NAD-binding domain-containing protein [Alphaproteobacteria bacterium]|nr:3-hydroxyacyl-CoA dehydrogenase NAD-binding domain-containing protein [Alphaproteobacteria bacterium]